MAEESCLPGNGVGCFAPVPAAVGTGSWPWFWLWPQQPPCDPAVPYARLSACGQVMSSPGGGSARFSFPCLSGRQSSGPAAGRGADRDQGPRPRDFALAPGELHRCWSLLPQPSFSCLKINTGDIRVTSLVGDTLLGSHGNSSHRFCFEELLFPERWSPHEATRGTCAQPFPFPSDFPPCRLQQDARRGSQCRQR